MALATDLGRRSPKRRLGSIKAGVALFVTMSLLGALTLHRASADQQPLRDFLDSLGEQLSGASVLQVDQLISLASKDTTQYDNSLSRFMGLYAEQLEDAVHTSLRKGQPRPDFDPTVIILMRHFKLDIPVEVVRSTGQVTLQPPSAGASTLPFPFSLLSVIGLGAGANTIREPTKINMTIRTTKLSALAAGLFEARRIELVEDMQNVATESAGASGMRTVMDLFGLELSQLRVLRNIIPYADCRLTMLVDLGSLSYDIVRANPDERKNWPQWTISDKNTMPDGAAQTVAQDVRRKWVDVVTLWRKGSDLPIGDKKLLKLSPTAKVLPDACPDATPQRLRDPGLTDRYDVDDLPTLPIVHR